MVVINAVYKRKQIFIMGRFLNQNVSLVNIGHHFSNACKFHTVQSEDFYNARWMEVSEEVFPTCFRAKSCGHGVIGSPEIPKQKYFQREKPEQKC